jgi:LAO/AO transport system kinase
MANPARAAREAAANPAGNRWTPPVLSTVGTREDGIAELAAAIDRHFGYLERSGELRRRRRERLRERVVEVVEEKLRRRLWKDSGTNSWVDEHIPALEDGSRTPFGVADELLAMSGELLTRTEKV